jgi:hypothetical protein
MSSFLAGTGGSTSQFTHGFSDRSLWSYSEGCSDIISEGKRERRGEKGERERERECERKKQNPRQEAAVFL